ncbi:MAG: UDP-N-acetylmuramate dehydrogenase [Desulfonauticus sp.]|nr:UDP-N-acetylmuramate dehydrogenase [Desulfonauticus sp.]
MQKITQPDLTFFSTIRLEASGNIIYFLESFHDWKEIVNLYLNGENPFLLGKGSNVIFASNTKRPIFKLIKKDNLTIVKEDNLEVEIKVHSSLNLKTLLQFCLKEGWSGLESLAGIPGSMGGVVAMNAGSFGTSIDAMWTRVRIWSQDDVLDLTKAEIKTGYRYFDPDLKFYLIESIWLKLKKEDKKIVKNKLKNVFLKKKSKQPLAYPNVGCIFKNPGQESAGKILDRCGFKGKRRGDLCFSPKHANFLINLGKGKPEDAFYLIQLAQEEVFKKEGILLEPEVILVKN